MRRPGNLFQQNRILATILKPELDTLAAKWVKTSGVNIVLVGDKAKILPSLQPFNLEIIALDADGNPVAAK